MMSAYVSLPLPTLLFVTQCASTLFMTGLIWFVQVVHYPLLREVGSGARLQRYEALHATRTGYVVLAPMLAELLSSLAMLYPPLRPLYVSGSLAVSLASLVLLLWLTTGFVQVPLHNALEGPSSSSIEQRNVSRLVLTNWIRTLAWTARSVLLLYVLGQALVPHPR